MDKAILFLTSSNRLDFVLVSSHNHRTTAAALDRLRASGSVPLFVTHAPSTGRASRPFFGRRDLLKEVMLNRADEFWRALVLADTAIAFA